jgi:outer membrane cobalamin receptor
MFPRRQSVALRILVVACTFVTCTDVIAQNDSISGKTHDLDEVIVSSHRLERNVLTTKPIQQMQRTELEMLGLQNLADAVKKFAGTSVKDYGGIGGMKTVSVRNLGAHHTAVSYDGVTISNTQAGQIDIGRFTLDNVETLSLAIGDEEEWLLSARHYASAGVLSIVTDKGTSNTKHFEAKVKGGSFGMVSPSIRWWQPLGERTMLNLNGSFMRADGVYPFVLKNGREKSNEKRYNSDIQSWQGEANLFHTWADSSKLDVKTCWYYSKRGLPGAVVLYNDKSDERLWDEDFFTQAVYSRMLGKAWSMKARMKYAHSWNRYEDTDTKYVNNKQIDVAR